MDLQAMINGMSANMQKERAEGEQLTLGEAITKLKELPQRAKVLTDNGDGIGTVDSYRGYYCDLSLEPFDGKGEYTTVAELLEILKGAMGKTYQGYKGGDYPMHERTPLWVAPYGNCGKMVMDFVFEDDTEVVYITTAEEEE